MKHAFRLAKLNNLALFHDCDLVCQMHGHPEVMCDEQIGESEGSL
jgi:hypothetical protein